MLLSHWCLPNRSRRPEADNLVSASVIEPYGTHNPVSEFSLKPRSRLSEVTVIHDDEVYTAIAVEGLERRVTVFIVANGDASASKDHQLKLAGQQYRWQGPYLLVDGD